LLGRGAGCLECSRWQSSASAPLAATPPSLTQRRSLFTRCAITPFPSISAAAVKQLSLHATTVAERNWSGWGRTYKNALRRLTVSTAKKLVYFAANLACEAHEQEPAEMLLGMVCPVW